MSSAWTRLKDFLCDPDHQYWNIFVLCVYTFVSGTCCSVMRNATKNWRKRPCIDEDPEFLGGILFEIVVASGGFFIPVLFYKVDPEDIYLFLNILDLAYALQYLYPVRVIIRIFEVIREWYLITKDICEITLTIKNSTDTSTVFNVALLQIVADIGRIFANYILLRYFVNDISPFLAYTLTSICVILNILFILSLRKCAPLPSCTFTEIFIKSFELLKTQQIWLYFYFFIYLSGQFIFSNSIYPSFLSHKQYCFITIENQLLFISHSIGSIVGSFFIIIMYHTFRNLETIIIGFIINLIAYFSVYRRAPNGPKLLSLLFLPPRKNIYFEVVIPFLLGFAETTAHTELIFLLARVYSREIFSVYAIYKLVYKLNSKIMNAVFAYCYLETSLMIQIFFAILGTSTILIAFDKEQKRLQHERLIHLNTLSEMGLP